MRTIGMEHKPKKIEKPVEHKIPEIKENRQEEVDKKKDK